ncbi:hypothetical protein GCM10022403_034650 [Streptomyces coacervatus]|uniref:Luciferase-like domain-containing protein n=1 Tax=Streptomyces coacervatus TaxID=647381 RepID=A0ABP7HNE7_9ACTN|nr:TIGR03619 family F420-dependent LLM class oxidoreductase [Streptomyces coacervatus]MDF2272061.1 TIGR03619 family F420-dependent LLM class oxidoreductase [Streptomyces coacervatus]
MEIGISLPTTSPEAWDPGLASLAWKAEEEGAASLWVNDHLAMVQDSKAPYPYSADKRMTWQATEPQLEALACLAHVAAVTTVARLGTAVLILPQRHPVAVAKAAATIDVLSAGRLTLGIGAGWLAEEMQALGYSFEDRGSRMDECVAVLRAAWTGRIDVATAAVDGQFSPSVNLLMYPRPVQKAGPPLLVGGMSAPARRRAARIGDGWLAVADAADVSARALAAHVEEIAAAREAAGRTSRFTNVLKINCVQVSEDGAVRAAAAARTAGFDEVVLDVSWRVPDQAFRCLHAAVKATA